MDFEPRELARDRQIPRIWAKDGDPGLDLANQAEQKRRRASSSLAQDSYLQPPLKIHQGKRIYRISWIMIPG
jgi:hypothetical protein